MDRVLLKTGEAHPELMCPTCRHAIYYSASKRVWKCSSCYWDANAKVIDGKK